MYVLNMVRIALISLINLMDLINLFADFFAIMGVFALLFHC